MPQSESLAVNLDNYLQSGTITPELAADAQIARFMAGFGIGPSRLERSFAKAYAKHHDTLIEIAEKCDSQIVLE